MSASFYRRSVKWTVWNACNATENAYQSNKNKAIHIHTAHVSVFHVYIKWKSGEQMKLDKNNPPWPVNAMGGGGAVATRALAKMETEKLVCCELKRKSWTFVVRRWQKGKKTHSIANSWMSFLPFPFAAATRTKLPKMTTKTRKRRRKKLTLFRPISMWLFSGATLFSRVNIRIQGENEGGRVLCVYIE